MDNTEILDKLAAFSKLYQKKYGFGRIGVFGSFARGTANEHSDVDIMVEKMKPDMFLLGNIKCDLEKEFGRKVDIVRIRDRMNSFLKKRIDREGIYV